MSDDIIPSFSDRKIAGVIKVYSVVIAAFFAMMVLGALLFSFGVFFKPISAQFGWTRAETSGAFSLAMILSGFLGILAGRLGDRFKPGLIIIVCSIIEGLAFLLLSQIQALWQLYFYYGILIGIGMSNIPPIISLVTRFYTKKRAMMIGITITGSGVGAAIASPLATYFISVYGWQISYLIIGGQILALVALLTAFLFYSGVLRQLKNESTSANKVHPGINGLSLKTAALTLPFWILGFIIFSTGFIQQVIAVHLVPRATDMGISAASAAVILSVINLATGTGSLGSGFVVERLGGWFAMVISLVLMLAGFIVLLGIKAELAFFLFAGLFGLSWGIIVISRSIIIASAFGLHSNGAITGALLFLYTIGGTIGPVIAGYIFDISKSYESAFILTASLGAISLVMTLPLKVSVKNFNR
jgi:MFS family permease